MGMSGGGGGEMTSCANLVVSNVYGERYLISLPSVYAGKRQCIEGSAMPEKKRLVREFQLS